VIVSRLSFRWVARLLFMALLACGRAEMGGPTDAAPDVAPDAGITELDAGLSTDAGSASLGTSVPVSCGASGRGTLQCFSNWRGSGIAAEVETPSGFDPATTPTVIFSHGANSSPRAYECYRQLWVERGIRTISPDLDDDITTGRAARWSSIKAIHAALLREQSANHVFFSGHSFGAYTTLLAAGADSRTASQDAGNCGGTTCEVLAAAGYVPVSAQPAQSALRASPSWFGRDAFRALAPHRLVIFGSVDYSVEDPCMSSSSATVPICRADSTVIDSSSSAADASYQVIAGFSHNNFACGQGWPSRADVGLLRQVVGVMGDWILARNGQ
jgi:pimeloyl-ACP methyl ester carboxylesterase